MRSDLANHEIKKGVEKDDRLDSYSGFAHTDLDEYLKEKKIKKHFIAWVATDWCVIETAKDSLKNGYETYIVTDAVRGVDESTTAAIYEAFEAMGGKLITSKEILEAA